MSLHADHSSLEYVEHISKFCHISRIKVNLENVLLVNLGREEDMDLVRHLEYVDMLDLNEVTSEYSLISKCSFNFLAENKLKKTDNETSPYAKKLLNVNHVYLFEIEQASLSPGDANYLRIFIKECDVNLVYTLFLYVVSVDAVSDQNEAKTLILDNSNCNFIIYVSLF